MEKAFKYLGGAIAVVLFVGYTSVAVFKLQELMLGVAVLGGIVLMAWDLWDSLKEKDH